MPVIVIGADTPLGEVVCDALSGRGGEVRAFVSDPQRMRRLRTRAVKVAVGDVSDSSHVAGAALGCFTAVLVGEAASDARERAFSDDPRGTIAVWIEAVAEASVQRLIWLGGSHDFDEARAREMIPEVTSISVTSQEPEAVASEVVRRDDLGRLDEV